MNWTSRGSESGSGTLDLPLLLQGRGRVTGERVAPLMFSAGTIVPSSAQPAFDIEGDALLIVVKGAGQVTPPARVMRTGAWIGSPLRDAVRGIREFASAASESPRVDVRAKRWEDGTPYTSVTVRAPFESLGEALALEDRLHDWMIDNVPETVRASLKVSVEPIL